LKVLDEETSNSYVGEKSLDGLSLTIENSPEDYGKRSGSPGEKLLKSMNHAEKQTVRSK
jgi:hypothetical protein